MTQWELRNGVRFLDENGAAYGIKHVNNKPRISSMPYLYDIAEGNVSGHTSWSKIGFNGALVADTEADLWSATGVYTFPTAAAGMEVVSSDNTQDIGTVIKGAVNNSVQADAGGSTTTLVDADVDFGAATAVAAGDCVILDPYGTTPEWGYVTTVATNTLTCAGGFSSGGTGASRYYAVLDKSAKTGAHAVKIEYLTSAYATKTEIVALNGTTVIPTVNTDLFRIQSFRVIATGTGNKPVGNLSLRNLADTPVYSYISAGFTRARNSAYTVPAAKTLYISEFAVSYGYKTNTTHYCRIYTRANMEAATGFNTGNLFYPFTEIICSNNSQLVRLDIPTKLTQKTDIKVSALATYAGAASVALRGWLE